MGIIFKPKRKRMLCNDTQKPVAPPMHLYLLLLNIFIPGCGTMLNPIVCKSRRFNMMAMIVGMVQMLLAFVFIGWIWSIYTGVHIYRISEEAFGDYKEPTP